MMLTEEQLLTLVDATSISRGRSYAQGKLVKLVEKNEDEVRAIVHGKKSYSTEIRRVDGDLQARCSCPAFYAASECKHIAALGMVLMQEEEPLAAPTKKRKGRATVMETVADYLSQQSPEELISLLLAEAKRSAEFRKQLEVRARLYGADGLDEASLRKELKRVMDRGGRIDYEGVERWAKELYAIVSAIAAVPLSRYHLQVRGLVEYALERLNEVLGYIDDSNGETSESIETLLHLHLSACAHGQPEPESMAEFLFRKNLVDSFGFFDDAITTYAQLLGVKGAEHYRKLVHEAWNRLPVRGSRIPKHGFEMVMSLSEEDVERYRLRGLIVRMYSDDLPSLLGALMKHMEREADYIDVARIQVALKQLDGAIDTLLQAEKIFSRGKQRGYRMFSRTKAMLLELYDASHRLEEALAMLWQMFSDEPNIELFEKLRHYAIKAGCWKDWKPRAVDVLYQRVAPKPAGRRQEIGSGYAGSDLVSAHLLEDEIDMAWSAAERYGCMDRQWIELALHHARNHMPKAIAILVRYTERAIAVGGNAEYRKAMGLIKQAHTYHREFPEDVGDHNFQQWIASLRLRHKSKRNMMALLDTEGLYSD